MLARLVAPLSMAGFFEAHWGRASRHFRAPQRARFDDLTPSDGWRAWVRASAVIDAATQDAAGSQKQRRVDAHSFEAAFDGGETICADVSGAEPVAAGLAAMTARLRPVEGEPFAKLYVSPTGAGFAMHMDAHHVFVVQLSGTKRWWFGDAPAVPHALLGGKVDPAGRAVHTYPRDGWPIAGPGGRPLLAPDRSALTSVVLEPGDVLYLPPGTWHTTRATEDSVALSVSPPRVPLSAVLLGALRERLDTDPQWRRDVVCTSTGGSVQSVSEALTWGVQRLPAEAAALTPDATTLGWARRTFAGPPPSPRELAPLQPQAVVRHVDGGFVWLRAPDPEDGTPAIFVFRPGIELALPAEAERFVTRLAAQPRATVAQIEAYEPSWTVEDTRDLLASLIEMGVLTVVTERA